MKSVVSNSGPLIHLTKVGLLHLLKEYNVFIPKEVVIEVVDRGKEKGHGDAILIENAIKEGWIQIINIESDEKFKSTADIAGLHEAEIPVIFYAYKKKYIALLDDASATVFARDLGISVRLSIGILIQSLKNKQITCSETLKTLDDLADVMYLSSDIYKLARTELVSYK
ncbi:MAG: hypothetical protein EAX96_20950 [Candidatus Lokiarchaeota archaeon]|nr:hypothetical protein [Candidatus Lokiarchaeota archaeon]